MIKNGGKTGKRNRK